MPVTNLDDFGKYFNLPEGKKLSDLISSEEEVSLTQHEELKVYSNEDFNTLLENSKSESEKAGREKVLKEMKEDLGLEFEGRKDPNKFVEALTNKVKTEALSEAKVEPNKKIESLQKDISSLQSQLQEKESVVQGLNNDISSMRTQSTRNELISKALPEKTVIEKGEVQTLVSSLVDLRFDEGKPVIYQDGEVLKNDLRNPVDALEHIKGIAQKYAVQTQPGGGGSDEAGGSGSGTLDAFNKRMEGKGVKEGSAQYMKELGEAQSRGEIKL